ncbi:MAG: DUF11 domain-containing protein [Oscillatoriales cyanobacterium SM2_2_1]|nr:DUF11 domain-containing protein [Oscillatoriales cyanobacterium SM2_2_1]
MIDPLGQILDCGGREFADYTGFSVALFEPAGPTGELGPLTALTPTTATGTPAGIPPNVLNVNPYTISNGAINGRRGLYNFLLDVGRGQTDVGRSYILVVNPPQTGGLAQRRVRITITSRQGSLLTYTATALDGRPIGVDGQFTLEATVVVADAAQVPLSLIALQINATVCESQEVQIVKTGDRAAAEPGDVATYRLTFRNPAATTLVNPIITDTLPAGFQYVPDSVRVRIADRAIPVAVTTNGNQVTFTIQGQLPPNTQGAILAYAVRITPDAVRGSGRNSAAIAATRLDNNFTVRDGPSVFTIRVRPGIVTDCATLLGRVFVDKNFDGEQQPGEPGVSNAVLYMDDGNRIVTDGNGLYSVINVLPGPRTIALDLTSVAGYTLAPNLNFIERNSPSRVVRLSPGVTARANFGVTPALQGGQSR